MSDLDFYMVQSDLLTDDSQKFTALHHICGVFFDWHAPETFDDRLLGISTVEMRELASLVFQQLKRSGFLGATAQRTRARIYNLLGTLSWLLPEKVVDKELEKIYVAFVIRHDQLYGTSLNRTLPVHRKRLEEETLFVGFAMDGIHTREVLHPDAPEGLR